MVSRGRHAPTDQKESAHTHSGTYRSSYLCFAPVAGVARMQVASLVALNFLRLRLAVRGLNPREDGTNNLTISRVSAAGSDRVSPVHACVQFRRSGDDVFLC
jgi:hypothetical protein